MIVPVRQDQTHPAEVSRHQDETALERLSLFGVLLEMAKVTSEKLEQLRLKKEELTAKLKKLQEQQRYQTRKDEARRKIITGAAVEAAVLGGDFSPELLTQVLDEYVTKQRERKLMGLETKAPDPGVGDEG